MGFCKRKGVDCECLTDHSTCNSDNCHRKLPDIDKKLLKGNKIMKHRIKRRMKYQQSEIEFWEALKLLDLMNPIKVVYNKKELYNDYDSKTVLRMLENGDKVYGEDTPPDIIIPVRFPELLNKRVYAINIEIVDFHHSIVYMYGEK